MFIICYAKRIKLIKEFCVSHCIALIEEIVNKKLISKLPDSEQLT